MIAIGLNWILLDLDEPPPRGVMDRSGEL